MQIPCHEGKPPAPGVQIPNPQDAKPQSRDAKPQPLRCKTPTSMRSPLHPALRAAPGGTPNPSWTVPGVVKSPCPIPGDRRRLLPAAAGASARLRSSGAGAAAPPLPASLSHRPAGRAQGPGLPLRAQRPSGPPRLGVAPAV